MSKKQSVSKKTKPSSGAKPSATAEKSTGQGWLSASSIRETIESVVIAFVLAFLFRTFEAEAFVIPTGSMAPTLMGRHKDLTCPECDYEFQVSASTEVRSDGTSEGIDQLVEWCMCPMCRSRVSLTPGNPQGEEYTSFKGDRILVGKFPYQFDEPDRWDVAVFKYPGEAQTNFIKRLVGLPSEELLIQNGDIFTQPLPKPDDTPGEIASWSIERKPPDKLLAMLQPVFDNRVMPKLIEGGSPPRWRTDEGWETEDYVQFQSKSDAQGDVWFRYEHIVPSWAYGFTHFETGMPSPDALRPQLIADFCAYNTQITRWSYATLANYNHRALPFGVLASARVHPTGLHWVGDLAVMCTVDVQSDSGELLLELVEGGRDMLCRIDIATGKATLTIGESDEFGNTAVTPDGRSYGPKAQTELKGPGEYDLIFVNADDQLRLWIDSDVVEFDTPTSYAPLHNTMPRAGNGGPSDLLPVGVGSSGAALAVCDLKIYRDIYYIAARGATSDFGITDFKTNIPPDHLANPRFWSVFSRENRTKLPPFRLKEDQFLALGDNSAESKDGRLWLGDATGPPDLQHFVHRDLLIGKAVFIYWPHSWDKIRSLGIPFPFFPNVTRMGFVR